MNSVCIECKEFDYYLPVENNIRPIGSNKLNINSTYIINNLFKTIKKHNNYFYNKCFVKNVCKNVWLKFESITCFTGSTVFECLQNVCRP